MSSAATRFSVLFLMFAAALLGGALVVDDQMGMGYLMGLFTVCLVNAALFLCVGRASPSTAS